MNRAEAEETVRAGIAALQRRDGHAARRHFEAIIASAPVPPPYILLAQACRTTGDIDSEEAALDKLLAENARDIHALIMRGDCHMRRGKDAAAAALYERALRTAAAAPAAVPQALAGELRRAESLALKARALFQEKLEGSLAGKGFGSGQRSARVQEALELLRGEKRLYLQEPSSFYFPGLPQRQFYEREEFSWVADVEAQFEGIRGELEAVLRAEGEFPPYIRSTPGRTPALPMLLDNPAWGAFHLITNGERVEENASRCPRTIQALQTVPMPSITGRAPNVLFSLLKPQAHIPAHNGMLNTRLICHLPLVVPKGCRFRVGNEVREWEEGRLLIFDDSIEHEAWNEGSETRVILLFEIWRPEISGAEQEALTAIFEAIVEYDGGALREEG